MSKIYLRLCTKMFIIDGLKKRRQQLEENLMFVFATLFLFLRSDRLHH